MSYYGDLLYNLKTVYIGGGTPSVLKLPQMERIFKGLENFTNLEELEEFSIEVNPNDVTRELLDLLKKYHVSRISMGVQTFDDRTLKFIGRNHTKEIAMHAYSLLSEYDFKSINLDFIYGIPGQTLRDIEVDLNLIGTLNPDHISYYSLIIEEKTILYHLIKRGKVEELDEDISMDMADLIDKKLAEFGYIKYEISNYAKPGKESIHNLLYWNLEEYLGIGLNASSQYNYMRVKNPERISEYLTGANQEVLTMHIMDDFNPRMEYLLMGLRKTAGINMKRFKEKYKIGVFELFPQLKKHIENGLLEISGESLKFTRKGIYLSNQVYVDII
jgi:oxygen-independent coproporphyrinogen-3 oxidase